MLPQDLKDRVSSPLARSNKIGAVERCSEATGVELKAALDAVEVVEREMNS